MIANEQLIEEVGKTPMVWDSVHPDYKNVAMKTQAWEGICRKLLADYDELSLQEKEVIVTEFRLRWKNIRDRYIRCFREKATGIKDVKPYYHAPRLQFLNKTIHHYYPSKRVGMDPYPLRGDDGYRVMDDGNDTSNVNGNVDGDCGDADSNNNLNDVVTHGDNASSNADDDGDNGNDSGNSVVENHDENAEPEQSSSHASSVSKKGAGRNQNEKSSNCNSTKDKRSEVKPSTKLPVTTKSVSEKKNHERSYPQAGNTELVNCSCSDSDYQDNSDDMDFFRSLLPLLTPLPLNQKINFRMDVMRIVLQYHENTHAPTMTPSNYYPPSTNGMNPSFQPFPHAQPFPSTPYNAYQPYYQKNPPNTKPVRPPAKSLAKKIVSDRLQASLKKTKGDHSKSSKSPAKKSLQVKPPQKSKGETRKPVRSPVYSQSDSSSTSVISDTNCDMETNCE